MGNKVENSARAWQLGQRTALGQVVHLSSRWGHQGNVDSGTQNNLRNETASDADGVFAELLDPDAL